MTGAYSNLKGIKIKNKYAMSFHFLIVWLATSETQYVYICFILVKQMIACTLFLQFFTAAKNEKYFREKILESSILPKNELEDFNFCFSLLGQKFSKSTDL